MNANRKTTLPILLIAAVLIQTVNTVQAQNGDQILDGIGETGMVARYVFDGNTKDWSRNNLHAQVQGTGARFVDDERFGSVLSLDGKGSFVAIPGEAWTNLESFSVSGWVYLRSQQSGQRIFDFGKNTDNHFSAAPTGTARHNGFEVTLTTLGDNVKSDGAPPLAVNKWIHIAIVVDIPSRSITTYVNSKPASETNGIPADNLAAVFELPQGTNNQCYIGRSLTPTDPYLNAMLYDFRIYRIPLSRRQIAGIYFNSRGNDNGVSVNTGRPEDDFPHFPTTRPQLYNAYLIHVANIEVETEVGSLPRLPRYIEGTYKDGIKGPKVRVLWPAPTDNSAVIEPRRYTVTGRVPGTAFQPKATVNVKRSEKRAPPRLTLAPFGLNQVSLETDGYHHDTKFIENRDKFVSTLAKTDPNSFLYMFRHAFGQPQSAGAKPLGVWDSKDTKLRGHATGHYLTAIAQAYACTGYDTALQANFADKMAYMVNTLYALSRLSGTPKQPGAAYNTDPTAVAYGPGKTAYDSDLSDEGIRTDYWNWGKGFISAYPPDQFIMLENGATYGGQTDQIWAPYYTLHKILAGLMDVYEISGNKKALEIAIGMSDWVHARLSQLPKDRLITMWNTYIAGEFGGMNEAMAHLYRLTNEPKYLKTAHLFDNIRLFFGDAEHSHGLAKNVDMLRGLHANQHIPQIVGSIEMYRVSNNLDYYNVANNFWYNVVNDYMYSIGGVAGARDPANAECFTAQPASLYANGFAAGGQNETCATYNMLKLSSDLFLFDQQAAYMDYYERGLYNHILASVAENSPANTYHVPLRPGSIKQFGNPDMTGFTCCNGTAMESSTKLQNTIYFKSTDNRALYVNLYIPSKLNWTERDIVVEQATSFPKDDETKLTIRGNGTFDIHVRVPGWATNGFFVEINGEEQIFHAKPGSYLNICRRWEDGDTISLKMPFQFRLEPVMDQQNIASLFYGPVLLAAQETEPRKEWRKLTLDAVDIGKSIDGDPQQLRFTIDGIVFKPFYETYGRHSVYLDVALQHNKH